MWERIQEKSSTWTCYTYSDNEFVGKLIFTFNYDYNNERLIPLMLDIDFDTQIKRTCDNHWFETKINNNYKYSCTYDLNKDDSLKIICYLILNLVSIKV